MGKINTKEKGSITEKQMAELDSLRDMAKAGLLTPAKQKIHDDLLAKSLKEPELAQTAKSYLIELYSENNFGRKKDVETDAMYKGTENEYDSISMYNLVTGGLVVAEQEKKEDDYKTGTIDTRTDKIIIDIKNKEDLEGFVKEYTEFKEAQKKYPNQKDWIDSNYWCQGQGYMDLWNFDLFRLVYTLTSAPEKLLIKKVAGSIFSTLKYDYDIQKMNVNEWAMNIIQAITLPDEEIIENLRQMAYLTNIDEKDLEIVKAAKQAYLNNYFDNEAFGFIPKERRIFYIDIPRDREWMAATDKKIGGQIREYYNSIDLPLNGK